MFQRLWLFLYYGYIRQMLKWLLHKITGACELQRLCSQFKPGAYRTKAIEWSMKYSRVSTLKRVYASEASTNVEESVNSVMVIKNISPVKDPIFKPIFTECLKQIVGYKKLQEDINALKHEKYSTENDEHERMLLKLWDLLMPDTPLPSRKTEEWTQIGFQGKDPATDFRGMGRLGLEDLVFFATQYNSTAKLTLSHSHHPSYGYSFAIVGINLSSVTHTLLTKGLLKAHFYNLTKSPPNVIHYHQVYCYLFTEFDRYWMEKKPNIMDFNIVKEKFVKQISSRLKDHKTILQTNYLSVQ